MTTCSPPSETISLAAAARLMRVDGKAPSTVSLWRWARRGKLGVRLQVWKRGRQLVTTPEAVRAFDAAVAEADAMRWEQHTVATTIIDTDTDVRAAALGI